MVSGCSVSLTQSSLASLDDVLTRFQVPHMPVGHMLDSLGRSIITLSFDLREKKALSALPGIQGGVPRPDNFVKEALCLPPVLSLDWDEGPLRAELVFQPLCMPC